MILKYAEIFLFYGFLHVNMLPLVFVIVACHSMQRDHLRHQREDSPRDSQRHPDHNGQREIFLHQSGQQRQDVHDAVQGLAECSTRTGT